VSATPERDGPVTVIGGGLAGCEVALQLAARGVAVRLVEQKPLRRTPAQSTDALAELVCSNSFRSANVQNAIGLLKHEMRAVGSRIMAAADRCAVPAGDALAVDRDAFAADVSAQIHQQPLIEVVHEVVHEVPRVGPTVVATGPLTGPELAADIARLAGQDSLYFYDAIAPIVDADGLDWSVLFRASRYGKGEGDDYANIPLNKAEYDAFVAEVAAGEKVVPREFEEARYFEGCLPIEVMVARGPLTLAHGPMKPVGLTDPRTGRWPYAAVQLRMENREGTAWNMVGFQTRLKYPEQRRIFQSLPGMQHAEFLRFGSVHRNTYLHAPSRLNDALSWFDRPDLWFAGQITGVEGYVESTACGLLIAFAVLAHRQGRALTPPPATTALGALRRHLRGEGLFGAYAPSNLNWSLFPELPLPPPGPSGKVRKWTKGDKRAHLVARAGVDLRGWWGASGLAVD
jgi:methylenetetrahydrofolate--tRNA-(uracil-5-)-methyltransferase